MLSQLTKSQLLLTLWSCMAVSALAENVISTNSGPSSNRVDVIFVGDGYQEDELDLYHQHLDGAIEYMFFGTEQPFNRYQNFFNFHRVEVISAESGADVPPDGHFVETALDSKFFFDGRTERLLSVNTTLANNVVNRSITGAIDVNMRFASINSERYGGAGGVYATFAGGNSQAFEIGLHEVAHSFSDLADEYVSFQTPYPSNEPNEPNVTTDPTGAKWERWIGYEQEGIGTIGVYEGARYYAEGIYRPSLDSKMRSLNRPFDAVSREQLVLDIYEYVDPIDSHQESGSLGFIDNAWVDLVDSEVIDLNWFLDGELLDFTGETLPIKQFQELRIAPGQYQLTAEAVDNTDWIRLEDQRPRESVSWNVSYLPGDFNGDSIIDAVDMDMLSAAALSGEHDSVFDLTGDALVDQSDRVFFANINHFLFGDSDLNGSVEFTDFLVLSGNFSTDASSWADGNFDGIDGVEFADFLELSGNFGITNAPATSSVPEPATQGLFAFATFSLLLLTRRRR